MRWLLAVTAVLGACAATSRTCPYESTLVTQELPTGRVETCASAAARLEELPVTGVTYEATLQIAHPQPRYGALDGPFTHWYPDGTIESHGNYVRDGETAVPDGVWGYWYPDGKRKSVGQYARGKPIGCFAAWDEQGIETTAIFDGDRTRVTACPPPIDESITSAEARSHGRDSRAVWGDVSLDAVALTGAFGARNLTRSAPDPSALGEGQLALRTNVGDFRLGGMLAYRAPDGGDDHGYALMAVAAYRLPLPTRRLAAEVEARAGVQYLDLFSPDLDAGLWSPIVGARVDVAYSLLDSFAIVLGATVESAPSRDSTKHSDECGDPLCATTTPYSETWQLGGTAYGIDLGLRVIIR